MTLRKAQQCFGVDKSTLSKAARGIPCSTAGGQLVLGADFKTQLVQKFLVCAECGYPLDTCDIRFFVKHFLNKCNKKIKCFRNNFPGKVWMSSFIKRHKEQLSLRLVTKIKKARAGICPKVVNDYSDNLEKVVLPVFPVPNMDDCKPQRARKPVNHFY